jgi:hypothetical protein
MNQFVLLAALCVSAPREIVVKLTPSDLGNQTRSLVTGPVLRPGEHSIGHVVIHADSSAGKDEAEPVVTLRIQGAANQAQMPALLRQGAIPLPDGGTAQTAGFIPGMHPDGNDLVAEIPAVPVAGSADTYDVVELSGSVEWSTDPVLVEDPKDTAPLGNRKMLVLVHGLDSGDLHPSASSDAQKTTVWDGLRSGPELAKVQANSKVYIYKYPTYRTTRENGQTLAQLIKQAQPNLNDGQLVLLAHSMGAQVIRYCAAASGMPAKTSLMATFAGAHHGSIMASLLLTNNRIRHKVGLGWWIVLRAAALFVPETPGLRSLCYDNYDRSVTAREVADYAIDTNPALASFNNSDPNVDKLVCLHGDIESLHGKGPFFGLGEEFVRRGAIAFNPLFGNIDPLVSYGSGIFEGNAHHVVTYPNIDHFEVVAQQPSWQAVSTMLDTLAHGGNPLGGRHARALPGVE